MGLIDKAYDPNEELESLHDEWPRAHGEALEAKKYAESVYNAALLVANKNEGLRSELMRKAWAKTQPQVIEAEERALQAEVDALAKKSRLEYLKMKFEAWRTVESTKRAEMTLR